MSDLYHNLEKSQEKKEINPLDPQTVFKISHKEIEATGKTQCAEHTFEKLNEKEVVCNICNTIRIL